jgi:hypothetical protein
MGRDAATEVGADNLGTRLDPDGVQGEAQPLIEAAFDEVPRHVGFLAAVRHWPPC